MLRSMVEKKIAENNLEVKKLQGVSRTEVNNINEKLAKKYWPGEHIESFI